MELNEIVAKLSAASNDKEQQNILHDFIQNSSQQDFDALAEQLKEQVVKLLWSNTQDALKFASLILYLAELTNKNEYRALGLRAKAQAVMLGMGEYQQALDIYDEALKIYQHLDDRVGAARVNVTRIWALANLGKYDQAVDEAEVAIHVLREHTQWRSLATLQNNLATIHNRAGESKLALEMHTQAKETYLQLGEEGEEYLASNELNRAWDFYELARYDDSIRASQNALDLANKFDQSTVIARAKHNMGVTYLRLGQNNTALQLFEEAKLIHLSNGQDHEAAMCELSSLDCLTELRRYEDVLRISKNIIPVFGEKDMRLEVAESIHFQALAFSKLGRYEDAIDAIQISKQLFEEEGNQLWISMTDLENATLQYRHGKIEECLNISKECIKAFEKLDHHAEAALARLVAARAASEIDQIEHAGELAHEALLVANRQEIPYLKYQACKVIGQLALKQDNIPVALNQFDQAITALEKLSGNMVTEFHASFFEDKQSVYEAAVDLCVRSGQVELSLAYAERAKSRALLKILAFSPQLGIRAQNKEDEPLVEDITNLRRERDRLIQFTKDHKYNQEFKDHQEQINSVESQMIALWHKLLVRNIDYSRQASLRQVQVEDAQPYLDRDVLLLEYFTIGEEIIVFLVSQDKGVCLHRLPATCLQVEQYLQLLQLNIRAVPHQGSTNMNDLTSNAQTLLGKLYQLLIEPFCEELRAYHQLIIVPHGALHYLPYHAFYDGNSYLIERYQISYLPGASFLRHYLEISSNNSGVLSVGHSFHDHIPNAVLEADRIAKIFNGDSIVEEEATLEQFLNLVSDKQILHLACHGEFRADNPLFSGLSLDDGWLTTLDIFNLDLNTSLVTLSACESGRSMVGGGDELVGIMRAFLAAGAASIVLSHWAVEDRSTLILIEEFYRLLFSGTTKAEALQLAQLHLMDFYEEPNSSEHDDLPEYSHPYFWAPFYLVGDFGHL